MTHRLSSVTYPQSNGRAELGLKTAKRIINDNLSHQGGIDNDQVAKALLQYRNTPLPYIKLSPEQFLLYRNLCNHIPRYEKHYHLYHEWLSIATEYEIAQSEKHKDILNQYNQSLKELPEIPVGSSALTHEPENKGIHCWIKSGVDWMFYQTSNTESNAIIQERLPLEIDGLLNQLNSKHHYQHYPQEIIMSDHIMISVLNRTFLINLKSTHQII